MLASSFEGLYASLWICTIGCLFGGIFALVKARRRSFGLCLATFCLLVSGFLLFDAIRYHQRGKFYIVSLGLAVAINTVALARGFTLKSNSKP